MALSRHVPYSVSLHSVIIDSGDKKLSQMAAHISSSQASLLAERTVLQKYGKNASVSQLAILCICQNITCSWNYFYYCYFFIFSAFLWRKNVAFTSSLWRHMNHQLADNFEEFFETMYYQHYRGLLFYLTNRITSNSGRCACRQAAERLPVFKICRKVGGTRFLI